MAISHYRKQRIMLLTRLNLGLASEDKEEVDLYIHYQKKYLFRRKSTTAIIKPENHNPKDRQKK